MPKRISSDAFLSILTAHDFRFVSQRGSHAKYRDSLGHTVIIPAKISPSAPSGP